MGPGPGPGPGTDGPRGGAAGDAALQPERARARAAGGDSMGPSAAVAEAERRVAGKSR